LTPAQRRGRQLFIVSKWRCSHVCRITL